MDIQSHYLNSMENSLEYDFYHPKKFFKNLKNDVLELQEIYEYRHRQPNSDHLRNMIVSVGSRIAGIMSILGGIAYPFLATQISVSNDFKQLTIFAIFAGCMLLQLGRIQRKEIFSPKTTVNSHPDGSDCTSIVARERLGYRKYLYRTDVLQTFSTSPETTEKSFTAFTYQILTDCHINGSEDFGRVGTTVIYTEDGIVIPNEDDEGQYPLPEWSMHKTFGPLPPSYVLDYIRRVMGESPKERKG